MKNKGSKIKLKWNKKTIKGITMLSITLGAILYMLYYIALAIYQYQQTHPVKTALLIAISGVFFMVWDFIEENKSKNAKHSKGGKSNAR